VLVDASDPLEGVILMFKYVAILTVLTSLLMSGKLFSQERNHRSPPGRKINGNVYDKNRQEPLARVPVTTRDK